MHVIDNASGYLSVIFSGSVDQGHLFQALKEIFMHPEYPVKNSVWVFEGCECDFSNISMFELLRMVKAYYPREATRKKTAIVTSTSLHHAMAQLFWISGRASETESLRISLSLAGLLFSATSWATLLYISLFLGFWFRFFLKPDRSPRPVRCIVKGAYTRRQERHST